MSVVAYFDRVKRGDLSEPSKAEALIVSKKIDQVTGAVVRHFISVVQNSPQEIRRISEILQAPSKPGPFHPRNFLLEKEHSFERFATFDHFFQSYRGHPLDACYFSTPDHERIYVTINHPRNKQTNLFHTVLGTGRSLPRYDVWSANDPTEDQGQSKYIDSLYHLEQARQPDFCGKIVFGYNAYKEGMITNEECYGSKYATVELDDQTNKKKDYRKEDKAALLLHRIMEVSLDFFSDPGHDEEVMNSNTNFSDIVGLSMADTDISVMPTDVFFATEKAIVHGDDSELHRLMENLFISSLEEKTLSDGALQKDVESKLRANAK